MLALRWQDVDLENAVVSVRRTLTRSGGRVVFGEPKTNKSRGCIRLSLQAVEALRFLQRAGLAHMRSHDLRHTCATLLLSRGVHPKFVQELLGHATIAITLDTYSHVMPSMGAATARAMEDALA